MKRNIHRVKLLYISPEAILESMVGTCYFGRNGDIRVITSDLPDDLAVLGVTFDPMKNMFALRVCSESFNEIPEGATLEILTPQVTCVYYKRANDVYIKAN